jgi:hypothetical protein
MLGGGGLGESQSQLLGIWAADASYVEDVALFSACGWEEHVETKR